MLRGVLETAARLHFSVLDVDIDHETTDHQVHLALRVAGGQNVQELVAELSEIDGIASVAVDDEPDA